MTLNRFLKSLSITALVSAAIGVSACATAGGDSTRVSGNLELPRTAVELIAKRYSSNPDLQRAAQGFANALWAEMRDAENKGIYNETLSLRSANAQTCLMARGVRLGHPITRKDLSEFISAMTPTPKLYAAFMKADSLSSGHPKEIALDETEACGLAGGL
jgi:hypothetical protein